MKFSKNFLEEYYPKKLSAEKLSEKLTNLGLEVDSYQEVGKKIDLVVVAKIIKIEKHSKNKNLNLVTLDIKNETTQVITAAKNIYVSMFVALAKPGAVINNIKITQRDFWGIKSNGMLCSAFELNLFEQDDCILELDENLNLGQCLFEQIKTLDYIFQIDLTANRGDCLSIIGLARDLIASDYQQTYSLEKINLTQEYNFNSNKQLTCEIKAKDLLNSYYLGQIENINNQKTTPFYIGEKLFKSGLRSIDLITDITNYVMILTGQPLHAFDSDKLDGNLQVRRSFANETLHFLDDKKIKATKDSLIISDEKEALALAGIFGCQKAKISKNTKNIIIESACFLKDPILTKSKEYNLHTEASHRFERGVDPLLGKKALVLVYQTLEKINSNITTTKIENFLPVLTKGQETIAIKPEVINSYLGTNIEKKEILKIFQALNFNPTEKENDVLVLAPSYRFDIKIKEDLIEEVARIYGFDNIPSEIPFSQDLSCNFKEQSINEIKEKVVSFGYQEAITYSFVNKEKIQKYEQQTDIIDLLSPLSSDMASMRTSLFLGLIATLSENLKYDLSGKFFEIGNVFSKEKNTIKQDQKLAFLVYGKKNIKNFFNKEPRDFDFFDLKEDLCKLLKQNLEFKKSCYKKLHPHQCADIYIKDKKIGYLGKIHPKIAKELELCSSSYFSQISLDPLLQKEKIIFQNFSKYQASTRDLAFVLKDEITVKSVINSIENIGIKQIVKIELFDLFKGLGIAEGFKSIGIKLIIQDMEKTLKDADIEKILTQVKQTLAKEHQAKLRE